MSIITTCFMGRSGFPAGIHCESDFSWIPALDGVEAKLKAGGKIADIGAGWVVDDSDGEAFPKSEVFGFDYHAGSIELANAAAEREGVSDRVILKWRRRRDIPGRIMTWWRSSIVCTIWATRWARQRTCIGAEAGWDVDGGRAVCGGCDRGEP